MAASSNHRHSKGSTCATATAAAASLMAWSLRLQLWKSDENRKNQKNHIEIWWIWWIWWNQLQKHCESTIRKKHGLALGLALGQTELAETAIWSPTFCRSREFRLSCYRAIAIVCCRHNWPEIELLRLSWASRLRRKNGSESQFTSQSINTHIVVNLVSPHLSSTCSFA